MHTAQILLIPVLKSLGQESNRHCFLRYVKINAAKQTYQINGVCCFLHTAHCNDSVLKYREVYLELLCAYNLLDESQDMLKCTVLSLFYVQVIKSNIFTQYIKMFVLVKKKLRL